MYTELKNQFSGVYDTAIEKVHMLRLKQLTLGYNLDRQIAGKIGLSGARLFMTMENLFLLTNYSGLDPEDCEYLQWIGCIVFLSASPEIYCWIDY